MTRIYCNNHVQTRRAVLSHPADLSIMTPDVVLQALGRVGLIGTLVEFLYALINLEDFTPFERAFFVASGTFEMVGVLCILAFMRKAILRQNNAPVAWELVKKYVNDPILTLANSLWGCEEGYDDELETGARFAIISSSAPVVFWWLALTIMVFGAGFVGDGDDHIMGVLAAVSFCIFLGFVVVGSLCMAGIRLPRYLTEGHAVLPYLYSVQKVFGLYLCLSRKDRLPSDELGKALIGFQLERLVVCAVNVVKYQLVLFFDRKNAREPQPASQQIEPSQQVASQPAAMPQHITLQLVAPQQAASEQVTPSPQQAASQQATQSQQVVSQPAAPPQHVTSQLVSPPQQVPSPPVSSP